jgi:hypothetical protein
MIEFSLITYLKSRPNITAIVGQNIFGGRAQQTATPPYLVVACNGGDRMYHASGSSGLVREELMLLCRGVSYMQSLQLFEALRNEIDCLSGVLDGKTIRGCFLGTPQNSTIPPAFGDDVGFPAITGEARIFWMQPVPTH